MMPDFEEGFCFEISQSDQVQSEKYSFYQQKYDEFSYLINKCNLHLLKRQLVCLFGYPTIQIESDKIFQYLEGIEEQSHSEQKRILRVLIGFIGEVTFIEDWKERISTIRTRIEQFLSIKGFGIPWNDEEWKKEIESVFETQYINPYFTKLPYSQFEYQKFFQMLDSPLPLQLKNLNHPCISQMLIAKSNDDFKYLCNILEFKNIKRIRKYIQTIIDKQEEFRKLIQKIEMNEFADYNDAKKQFDFISLELENIIQADLSLADKSKARTETRKKQQKFQDDQTEINSSIQATSQITAPTLTTLTYNYNENKPKKLKKKQKIENKFEMPQQFLFKLDQDSNSQEIILSNKFQIVEEKINLNEKMIIEEKNIDQEIQIQEVNSKIPYPIKQKIQITLEELKCKIQSYQKISDSLEEIGFPCVNLDEQKLIQISKNFNVFYNDKNLFLQQIASCVWESLSLNKFQGDIQNIVSQKIQTFIHPIKLSITLDEYENILNSCYEKTAQFPINEKFQIQRFSYDKLATILNRQFPEQIYKYQNTSSRVVFKAKSIIYLQQIFNNKEIQNIRIIRAFIKDTYQLLQKLITFKQKIIKYKNRGIDDQLVQLFFQQEQEYLKFQEKQLNFKFETKIEKQNNIQEKVCNNNPIILIDEKDQFDKYFSFEKVQKENQEQKVFEIEDDDDCCIFQKTPNNNFANSIKVEENLKINIEDCQQLDICPQQNFFDLVTPNNNRVPSPFILTSPQFNFTASPLQKIEFDWVEGNDLMSPDQKQFQFQNSYHFN